MSSQKKFQPLKRVLQFFNKKVSHTELNEDYEKLKRELDTILEDTHRRKK